MEGKRLIEKIRLRNILSFGDKGEEIELLPLNVIIGQNASGKSNLVDVLKLLRSLPGDKGIIGFISQTGGINEWIWKGNSDLSDSAQIEILLENHKEANIEYNITFNKFDQNLYIETESVKETKGKGFSTVNFKPMKNSNASVQYNYSILSYKNNLRNKDRFNNENGGLISIVVNCFFGIVTFTDLQTTRNSEIRKPQLPDALNDFLAEDGSNLNLVLNDFEFRGNIKDKIIENLKKFNPQIKDYSVRILGGTVQLFIREEGLEKPISAMRLSDGTLRYLCLLAILCHPEPPPLICIEEPEVGLHPDILPTIAELMKEASQRTQLIVTTHSDILVSAFSDMPEAVLVCEKDEDGTHFRRLDKENLTEWLNEYSLGELWLKGEIGGTRW